MRSWQSLWLTSVLGLTACATDVVIAEPYKCSPFHANLRATQQYFAQWDVDIHLAEVGLPPETDALRGWIREADRVCRANNRLRAQ